MTEVEVSFQGGGQASSGLGGCTRGWGSTDKQGGRVLAEPHQASESERQPLCARPPIRPVQPPAWLAVCWGLARGGHSSLPLTSQGHVDVLLHVVSPARRGEGTRERGEARAAEGSELTAGVW